MSKKEDLQPWLDYFDMLRNYEYRGFLEVVPDKHEVYVTQAALHAISKGDDPSQQIKDGSIRDTARRLRTYCGWKSQQGASYLKKEFVIHVVKDDCPHDLIYTLFLYKEPSWWWPWWKKERIEVINVINYV